MNYTIALPSLSPREAVIDALHRIVDGMDNNNHELWESGCLKTEEMSFRIGDNVIQGWNAVDGYITNKIFTLHTTHFITNIRVDIKDGADTAYLTAHALAYHYKPEDAFKPDGKPFTSGGLYYVDFVKDKSDGLWKLKTWTLKLNWTDGNMAAVIG
jgi:SnoaL-like domain